MWIYKQYESAAASEAEAAATVATASEPEIAATVATASEPAATVASAVSETIAATAATLAAATSAMEASFMRRRTGCGVCFAGSSGLASRYCSVYSPSAKGQQEA